MPLQEWSRRDKRSDTCRDPYGGGQDVVNHERRGRKQSGKLSKVLTGHRVGTAARRVGFNGLAIGEIDDREQDDDAGGDRQKVSNSSGAQRDEQRKCRLRAVRSGAERVQSEDGHACCWPQLFSSFFRGTQGPSKQQIRQ